MDEQARPHGAGDPTDPQTGQPQTGQPQTMQPQTGQPYPTAWHPYGTQSSGTPTYAPHAGTQPNGTEQNGGQRYGTQQFGTSPFGAPQYGQYGSQQYGSQPYGSQPYGTPTAGGPGAVPPVFQPPSAEPQPAPGGRRAGRWRIGIAGLVAGAVIGGATGAGVVALSDHGSTTTAPTASAQSVVIKDPQTATDATAAAAKAAPSVVTVYVTAAAGSGSGSGVVLTADGYVLTNNHVVDLEGQGGGNVQIQVRTSDGALHDATVVGTDATFDLAVIKLDGVSGLTPATFADSDKVQVGDLAVAIGAPLGLSNTVTDGIISATGRAVATGSTQDDGTVIDALQTDAAINPGNSGGALVNGAGEVVGINTAIASVASGTPGSSGQSGNIGVGFAIPSNTAKRIADEIVKTGKASHAVLGVSAKTAGDASSAVGEGAQIASVQDGSGAAQAGLQVGDVITAVGDRQVTTSTELTAAIRALAPDSQATLTVRRGNQTNTVQVTLGSTS